ncbi:uncharacterized protein N7498_004890 [Penicillium cinerascens]|uniref:Extracellular membrane protein CFEM domain-containing protein n=1 Tax=Penicillium cinerascens TaxID=70096 RepID=A0A9W9MMD3_9EURO|nr:uncharacterized protein N7498_004890 [Penicillium cinerascens]KAJ5204011.1 hypothetical protein N7498_004890 [Penicillium cinerascens]
MRLLLILGLISPGLASPLATSQLVAREEAVPQCAIDCKQQILADSVTQCSTNNTPCLCADKVYQAKLEDCWSANCTTPESLTAQYLNSRECDIPIVQRYPAADPGTLIPFIVASILFTIRMAAKSKHLGCGWGADDYTIIVAYGLAVIIYSLNVSMIQYGFGKNIWDIVPQDDITKAYKRFYAFIHVYKALISLAKISVCLFLLRIFQTPIFRYITYTMIVVNTAIAISWILVDSFHCIPVHLAWTGWEHEESGKCINFITSTFVNGFVNIAVDVIMVMMPMWEVLKLTLSFRKKLGVAVMFGMGLVLTAVGIVRVIILSRNDSTENPTFEMEPLNYWSVIECQVAIICACLPATRAFIVHYIPGMLGQSENASSSGGAHTSSNPRSKTISAVHPGNLGFISKTVSYRVDSTGRSSQSASDSFVKLVEIQSQRT